MLTFTCFLLLVLAAAPMSAAADPELLFSDNFETLAPGWGEESSSKKVENHQLVMILEPEKIRNSLYAGRTFRDVDIRVQLLQEEGDIDQPAGIIFWALDVDNYYAVRVQSNGEFLITRKMRGKWLNPVNTGIPLKAIHPIKEWNDLRVVTSGRRVSAYVNGSPIAEVEGFPPSDESQIGLFIESGEQPCRWRFQNLQVFAAPRSDAIAPAAGVVFVDKFDTVSPVWGGANEIQQAEGGKLIMTLKPDLIRRVHYEGAVVDDADIRVTIRQRSGDEDQCAGLIFWSERTNYVAFLLRSNGQLTIRRVRKGMPPTVNDLDPPEFFNTGINAENQLQVTTHGKNADLLINGKKLATYQGFPPENGSRVGLLAESGAKPCVWEFDNFELREVTQK